jgi:hypothetical protein
VPRRLKVLVTADRRRLLRSHRREVCKGMA